MKVLLDECLDRRLAGAIIGHDVETVPERGWANVKNGQILTLAQTDSDVFITVDRSLPHQQHLPRYDLAVVVLHARSNRLADLEMLLPMLLRLLPTAPKGAATLVEG